MPSGWNLRSNEKFIRGEGHAEEVILNALSSDDTVGFGGTSRNICREICYRRLATRNMMFGGVGYFGGYPDKTSYSYFWQEDD